MSSTSWHVSSTNYMQQLRRKNQEHGGRVFAAARLWGGSLLRRVWGKIHFFVRTGNCDDTSLKLPLWQWEMWAIFPWQYRLTLFQRRMKKRGLYKRLYHVSTQKLEDRPRILIRSPRCKVSHPNFSNPHTYTVRSMLAAGHRSSSAACRCW